MKLIRINQTDNVAVAVDKIDRGIRIDDLEVIDEIPMGHKVALKDIREGEDIIKYAQVIGVASKDIRKGEHVHSHNMHTKLSGELEYSFNQVSYTDSKAQSPYKLYGYRRNNGKVGIRNELWLIPTVGCISSICKDIISRFKNSHDLKDIDGAYTYSHQYGCSQMGDDQEDTIKVLRNIAAHPNAGAVLVVGLGCENNQLKPFIEGLKDIDPKRLRYFNCQDVDDEVSVALDYLDELYETMRHDRREPIEFRDLVIGLECGGSDGFSGISGNPLLGRASDRIISYGGNVILSEVPEMFGAEHLLMNRAKDRKVFEQIVDMINRYKQYFIDNRQVVYENPSPGNKAGGITTLEEKSCGCIQKGGTSIINGVIDYGDTIKETGLNLLYGPGNDLSSTTALGSAGAQILLFTTGRGTPYGSFVPTVKVATNSLVYNKKRSWFDYNAGTILEDVSLEQACDDFMKKLAAVINGEEKTRNEEKEYKEIAIFKRGVIL